MSVGEAPWIYARVLQQALKGCGWHDAPSATHNSVYCDAHRSHIADLGTRLCTKTAIRLRCVWRIVEYTLSNNLNSVVKI
jgi:hypothetical protein